MKEQNYRGSQNSPRRTPGLPAAPAGTGQQPSKAVGPGSLGPPPAAAPRQAASTASVPSSSATPRKPAFARTLTHAQIAARAREIWQAKGCKSGQDLQNWHEAEAQLKAEMNRSA